MPHITVRSGGLLLATSSLNRKILTTEIRILKEKIIGALTDKKILQGPKPEDPYIIGTERLFKP